MRRAAHGIALGGGGRAGWLLAGGIGVGAGFGSVMVGLRLPRCGAGSGLDGLLGWLGRGVGCRAWGWSTGWLGVWVGSCGFRGWPGAIG
ncbi:MAG UNVERIFIED_CONTAM: hypothetical protein LVR29_16195 [Microcystis novacekii LVE1205-3]